MSDETEKQPVATVSTTPPAPAEPSRSLQSFDDFERLFEGFFRPGALRSLLDWERPFMGEMLAGFEGRLPRVDVIDREADVLVRAEVPGVDRKDLEISLDHNLLTIKGSFGGEPQETKDERIHRCEIRRGTFSRSVSLPAHVDSEQAGASLKDGVLEITLPKTPGAKRKTIDVQ